MPVREATPRAPLCSRLKKKKSRVVSRPTVKRQALTVVAHSPVHSGWMLPWTWATKSPCANPVVLRPA